MKKTVGNTSEQGQVPIMEKVKKAVILAADDKTAHTAFNKSDNKNDKDDKPYPYDRRCRSSEGRTADNRS